MVIDTQSIVSFLETPVGFFVALEVLDIIGGVAVAVKQGGLKAIDSQRFPSFLRSSLATKEAGVVAGAALTAAITSSAASVGGTVDLQHIALAAWAVAQLGAGAMSLALLGDLKNKALKLLGQSSDPVITA